MRSIKVKIIDKRIELPEKATIDSAGFDLQAAIDEEIILLPGESRLIPTGLAIYIEDNSIVGMIHPRSKLGAKQGLVVGNLTGIIDSDYQGQWFVSAWNRNFNESIRIQPLDRIAQVCFIQLAKVSFGEVDEFDTITERNNDGISKETDTTSKN